MCALAVSLVRSERSGVKMQEVSRVVAVDVGVFKNVRLRTKYAEMANCAVYYTRVAISQGVSQARPIRLSLKSLDGVGDSHCCAQSTWYVVGGACGRTLSPRELLALLRCLDVFLLNPIDFLERLVADSQRYSNIAGRDRRTLRPWRGRSRPLGGARRLLVAHGQSSTIDRGLPAHPFSRVPLRSARG